MGYKPGNSTLCPLLQFPLKFLPWLPQWWSVTLRVSSRNKPFPPQPAFGHGAYHSNSNPNEYSFLQTSIVSRSYCVTVLNTALVTLLLIATVLCCLFTMLKAHMCHRMYLDVRNELQEPILSPCIGSGHLTQVIRHVDKDLTHGAVLTAPICN